MLQKRRLSRLSFCSFPDGKKFQIDGKSICDDRPETTTPTGIPDLNEMRNYVSLIGNTVVFTTVESLMFYFLSFELFFKKVKQNMFAHKNKKNCCFLE